MIFVVVIVFVVLLVSEIVILRRFNKRCRDKEQRLLSKINALKEEDTSLERDIKRREEQESIQLLFYDLARKISPILNKEEIFSMFSDEIKYLGNIDNISFSQEVDANSYLSFSLGRYHNKDQMFSVKTSSKKAIAVLPLFAKLLKLCLDRIKLYEKIQRLSIYDSLLDVYNRRYFMSRFSEEFQRANKFKLNLSFLMVDIDHFKNVNDTYGHLVGDVALRNVARLIKESVREIDCVARFGGEEFAVILLDTDKNGAIMVAERICSKIRNKKIKAFDERLMVTVSVGIASFPQNTIYSDVLMEVADKALYKAKVSGRNKTSWF